MSNNRILVLGSYPATNPRHGGQIRLAQIVAAYRAQGLDVQLATFFPSNAFYMAAPLGSADVALPTPGLQAWRGHAAPFIEDLASGELVAHDDKRMEALERHAGRCRLVHVEQPWLWPVVQRLRERGNVGDFRVVYGSQNIEHKLKRAIFRQYDVREGQFLLDAIEALERDCASRADLVAAVTEEDAAVLRAWTASPVVVAPNGIEPWRSEPQQLDRWRARLGSEPFALYVASAHPPNVVGFAESFGECLAALSPVQKVVLAGTVAEHIVASPWYRGWAQLNDRRVVSVGPVSDEELSALRDLAHTFILPMTSGEGSNLKSAEALYSGRWVVATPHAMRGFERFRDVARIRVREPGPAFGQAVSETLRQPLPQPVPGEPDREELTWARTLGPLCRAVTGLAVPA